MYNRPWPPPPFTRQPPPPPTLPRAYLPPGHAPSLGPPPFDPSRFPPPPVRFCPPHQLAPPPWPSSDPDSQVFPVRYPIISGQCDSVLALQPPPPPPPSTPSDPVQRITELWMSWMNQIEPLLIARRRSHQTKSDCPSLPQLRNRFLRWHELVERVRDGGPDDCSLELLEELSQLQHECSDPDLIKRTQRKLALIQRKRRYKRRIRDRRKTSRNDDTIVLRSSISAVLDRLRYESLPSHTVTERLPEQRRLSPSGQEQDGSTSSANRSLTDKDIRKDSIRIQQAVAECRERLALLGGLERLRTARLAQARKKGGLFPEAFDQAFVAQIHELTGMLNAQLSRLLELEKTVQQSVTEVATSERDGDKSNTHRSTLTCCDHWPSLSDSWKHILFGSAETPKDVPWRWQRFYHQADFDFSDFLRIRKSWDLHLVPQETSDETDTSAAVGNSNMEPSLLLASWHVPLNSESSDTGWDFQCTQ